MPPILSPPAPALTRLFGHPACMPGASPPAHPRCPSTGARRRRCTCAHCATSANPLRCASFMMLTASSTVVPSTTCACPAGWSKRTTGECRAARCSAATAQQQRAACSTVVPPAGDAMDGTTGQGEGGMQAREGRPTGRGSPSRRQRKAPTQGSTAACARLPSAPLLLLLRLLRAPPAHLHQHLDHILSPVDVVVVQQHPVLRRAAALGLAPPVLTRRHRGAVEHVAAGAAAG